MLLVIFCKVFLFIWIVTEQKSSSITVFLLFLTLFTENFFPHCFRRPMKRILMVKVVMKVMKRYYPVIFPLMTAHKQMYVVRLAWYVLVGISVLSLAQLHPTHTHTEIGMVIIGFRSSYRTFFSVSNESYLERVIPAHRKIRPS